MKSSIEGRNPVSTFKHVFWCRPFHNSGTAFSSTPWFKPWALMTLCRTQVLHDRNGLALLQVLNIQAFMLLKFLLLEEKNLAVQVSTCASYSIRGPGFDSLSGDCLSFLNHFVRFAKSSREMQEENLKEVMTS
jgi:hypothetical protein